LATSFDLLHPEIRRWIWSQNWESLRAVQDLTIQAVFNSSSDLVISAATAAGKTEAAFLPILSQVADRKEPGLSVLYVGPLKALINDQFTRLDALCDQLGLSVVRWHGDAPQGAKSRLLKAPSGIALITPESIEALLIRRPAQAAALFSSLDFIVIDELHAFLHGPRGLHLSSLLRRITMSSPHRPRRVGLSATLGDFSDAKAWLNPAAPQTVTLINPAQDSPNVLLQIRAYVDDPRVRTPFGIEEEGEDWHPTAFDQIADHIYEELRGSNNLIFAGSRSKVETLSDRLRRRSERARVPNEFFPHHGNLSKELREDLEQRLKGGNLPTTGVATTTLELGIDIGSVKSVAQIGPPHSLASLRQRLGRSGRRHGQPAILRIYLREPYLSADADIIAALRFDVAQSVAAINLLIRKFVEPSGQEPSVATVALHQTLSLICERGALPASDLFRMISYGPLAVLTQADYGSLLRGMAQARLIEQAPDGQIMLGEEGERLTARHDFYAIFETDEEWRLVASGRPLGTVPISNAVAIGSMIIFGGQRWRVVAVDERGKVLEVVVHRSAIPPQFEPVEWEGLHEVFVKEIKAIYERNDQPAYLNDTARALLSQGRATYRALDLTHQRVVEFKRDTHLFLWEGAEVCDLMKIALIAAGVLVESASDGVLTVLDTDAATVRGLLQQMAHNPPSIHTLAECLENIRTAKFDEFVPDDLLRSLWSRRVEKHESRLHQIVAEIVAI
jgi:ATP-dependent Lhr-like helicase